MKQMEEILYRGVEQPQTLLDLFSSAVRDEMELYSGGFNVQESNVQDTAAAAAPGNA